MTYYRGVYIKEYNNFTLIKFNFKSFRVLRVGSPYYKFDVFFVYRSSADGGLRFLPLGGSGCRISIISASAAARAQWFYFNQHSVAPKVFQLGRFDNNIEEHKNNNIYVAAEVDILKRFITAVSP